MLELEGLKPRGDLSDWLAKEGNDKEKLLGLAERVVPEPMRGHFNVINPAEWEGAPVPVREWIVSDFIPVDTVGFVYGDGGVGKSLLMLMLAASMATEKQWLGKDVKPGRALYLSCEDDPGELHRRLDAIRQHLGVAFSNLEGIRIADLVGQDAVLGELQRDGTIDATRLYSAVAREIGRHDAKLVVIDALANVYAGDENNRSQARQFVSMLQRLAVNGRAIAVLAHPSLSGMSTGRGTSGSTGWSNSGRWRAYFENAKLKDGEPDLGLRTLKIAKSNYGPVNAEITVKWEAGVWVTVDSSDAGIAKAGAMAIFISILARLTREGRKVGHSPGPNYAPKLFADEPEATGQGLTKERLGVAMAELFKLGKIVAIEEGPASRRRSYVTLAEGVGVPDEDDGPI